MNRVDGFVEFLEGKQITEVVPCYLLNAYYFEKIIIEDVRNKKFIKKVTWEDEVIPSLKNKN